MNDDMNEEEREGWEDLARSERKLNADVERLCKDSNLSEEQRQEILEKLEMDQLVNREVAREIAGLLESKKELAVLQIINLVREEILKAITPLFDKGRLSAAIAARWEAVNCRRSRFLESTWISRYDRRSTPTNRRAA